ncbi:MAG TPA: tetratricopeptide repeat protein [bacterium]|nr:tetratricopeptide repeat protein [bacterium]
MIESLNLIVICFFFFVSCSSVPVVKTGSDYPSSQQKRPELSPDAPAWALQVHFTENGVHYFTGRSTGEKNMGECHEKALRDALHQVSRYVKVELKSLSKSYEEMVTGEDAEMVTAVSTEKKAYITLKEYFSDYYNEQRYESGSVVNDCFVKILVSSADMEKIRVQAADITGWKMDVQQGCGNGELLTALFKNMASINGWKLSREQAGNGQSGYAFFAETSVTCNGSMINIVTTRNDLTAESTVQTIFASGNDMNELKKNYFFSSGIYLPVINYAEYPDVEKSGIFSKLNVEVLKLYNEAFNYEKKGRLFPEKAMNSWSMLYNYSGENPFKTLAKERIEFYKNMETAAQNTVVSYDADLKKLEQVILMTSIPAEKVWEHLNSFFETYGAFAGRKVINKLIEAISPAEKKTQVKSMLFENKEASTKWKSSCNAGNGAYCYLYSFTNEPDGRDMKKKSCQHSVKKACIELADDAVDAKQGDSAVYFGEKACHLGEKSWCFKAGKILYSGEHGVKVNVIKALPLLGDSCEVDDVRGCAYLGFIYEKGEAGKKDPLKSKFYYDKSCNLGLKESCNKTGE